MVDLDNCVWYHTKNDLWEMGEIVKKSGGILTLKLVNSGRTTSVRETSVLSVNNINLKDIHDLSILDYLHEPAVTNALSERYLNDIIYTKTGSTLVAINPFRLIEGLYGTKKTQAYHTHWEEQTPHIYSVIEKAYRNLCENNSLSQVLMVSGESGAGKTETAKYVMHYICDVTLGKNSSVSKSLIESTNPILEAFGNAKTTKNHNSSRFGKFMRLQFNDENKIIGAKIDVYLLEKVRISSVAKDERNYHIFYQLLAGLEKEVLEDLYLDKKLKYLGNSQETLQDASNWEETLNALQIFEFNDDQIYQLFRIIAGILLMGNIEFKPDEDNKAVILNPEIIEEIADIMKIDEEKLADTLCHNNITIRGEKMKPKLSVQQAYSARDTLARDLYEGLFLYLVSWINRKIDQTNLESKFIGILDIFGFEKMEHNRLEQLCINYTNECLQNQLNKLTFDELLQEYRQEEITIPDITCPDNQPMIELISSGSNSIFHLLVDECHLPRGNDKNLVNKFIRTHNKTEPGYCEGHPSDKKITINHYAGNVTYEFDGFCERNSKKWNAGLSDMMKDSGLEMIKNIHNNMNKPKSNSTVVSEFEKQLSNLLKLIRKTDQHFIRCIKPNDASEAGKISQKKLLDQLRAGGVVEAIRISRMGYPVRMSQVEFVRRYKFLVPNSAATAESVATSLGLNLTDYSVGKTKIFMNQEAYDPLEERRRRKLIDSSIIIQSRIRMAIVKCWYDQTIERKKREKESAAFRIISKLLPFIKWKLSNKKTLPVPEVVKNTNAGSMVRNNDLFEHTPAFECESLKIQPRETGGCLSKRIKRKLKIGATLVVSHAGMVGAGILVGVLCL